MKSFIFFLLLIYFTNCLRCSNKVEKYIFQKCGKQTVAKYENNKWVIGCGLSDNDYSTIKKRIIQNTRERKNKIIKWHKKKIKWVIQPELNNYMNKFKWTQNEYDALCIYGTNGHSVKEICENSNNKPEIESKLRSPEKEIFKSGKYNF